MDAINEFFPRTVREKVMIYQILSELETVLLNTSSKRIIFGIFPVSNDAVAFEIHNWVSEQFKLIKQQDNDECIACM
jgi:hypothetical protein